MALGAIGGNVIWLLMKEVLLLVGVGAAIGLPAAWMLSKLAQAQLYGLAAHDPATIGIAVAAIVLVACLAWQATSRRCAQRGSIRLRRCATNSVGRTPVVRAGVHARPL